MEYFLDKNQAYLTADKERVRSGLYSFDGGSHTVLIHVGGNRVSLTTDHGPNALGFTPIVVSRLRLIKKDEITPEMRTWLRTASTSWSNGLTDLATRLAQS